MSYCPVESCGRSFSKQFNLKRHMQTAHITEENKAVCPDCGRSLKNQSSLSRHRSRCTSDSKKAKQKIFSCPYCEEMLGSFDLFEGHILEVGLQQMTVRFYSNDANFWTLQFHPESPLHEQTLTFASIPEFDSWKDSLGNAQYVTFSNRLHSDTGKIYKTFICRRSCETACNLKQYVLGDTENENCRPSRSKASCKLNEACCSRIFATIKEDAGVSVRFIFQHTGHDPDDAQELQFLHLSAFIRRKITMQLLQKVDEKSIVRSINQSLRNRNDRHYHIEVSETEFYCFVSILSFESVVFS